MKTTALCLLIGLCATVAGCVVIPEGHWWHEHHEHRASNEATIQVAQHPVGRTG